MTPTRPSPFDAHSTFATIAAAADRTPAAIPDQDREPTPKRTEAATHNSAGEPHLVVLSSLFPNSTQPNAGLFVRERMFRVGQQMPVAVVSPRPWFPLQSLLRLLRPGFRPGAPAFEKQQGNDCWFPRFFCVPGLSSGSTVSSWPSAPTPA